MNDTELDELLNTWTVAAPPDSLRDSVRNKFRAMPPRLRKPGFQVRWNAVFTGAAVAAAGIFFVTTIAFPQTKGIPYNVESEFIRYARDGTPTVVMNEVSYSYQGQETMLSRSLPDSTQTVLARTVDLVGMFVHHLDQVHRHVIGGLMNMTPLQPVTRVVAGCADQPCLLLEFYAVGAPADLQSSACVAANKLIGEDKILNYPTKVVQFRGRDDNERRTTFWMAPELSCFALKIVTEEKQADGTYRAISERRALKVTLNP